MRRSRNYVRDFAILDLRERVGLTYEEIGQRVHLSRERVRQLYARCVKQRKEYLKLASEIQAKLL